MLKIPLWLNHVEKYHDGRPQNGKQPRKWKMAMERLASPKQGHSPCPWKHIMIFTNPWTWDKNCLGTEVSTPNDKNHFPGKYQASIEAELMYSVSEVWVASFTWSAYALQREKNPSNIDMRPLPCRWASSQWGQVGFRLVPNLCGFRDGTI